jgi:tetratricopeptide (TPR) repeat protein
MENNLEFLTTARSDVPLRHQSLQTVLDYTWSDLAADQRSILAKLSILRGRFAIDTALAISGATPIQLAQLISKSLLQGYDDYHYVLHELVRRYALEKLRDSDDLAATCAAYTAWAQKWFANLRDRRLLLHEYLAEIDHAYHHIWNFDWMPPAQQHAHFLTVCGYLGTYWIIRDIHQAEATRILEAALQTNALDSTLQAAGLIQLGRLYLNERRYAQAASALEQGIAACQSTATLILEGLAFVWLRESQTARESDSAAPASIPIEQKTGKSEPKTQEIVSAAYGRLVLLYFELEDFENAAALLSIVSKHYQTSKMNAEAAIYLNLEGIIALKQADHDRARQHFDKALNLVATAQQPLLQAAIQRNRDQAGS